MGKSGFFPVVLLPVWTCLSEALFSFFLPQSSCCSHDKQDTSLSRSHQDTMVPWCDLLQRIVHGSELHNADDSKNKNSFMNGMYSGRHHEYCIILSDDPINQRETKFSPDLLHHVHPVTRLIKDHVRHSVAYVHPAALWRIKRQTTWQPRHHDQQGLYHLVMRSQLARGQRALTPS